MNSGRVMKRLNKQGLKELPLRPYPGYVFVTRDRAAFKRAAKDLFGMDENLSGKSGRFIAGPSFYHPFTALIWWTKPPQLAHELAHVIFWLFDEVGIDSHGHRNEPFCYLLSQLMLEAMEK